ncbi:MAG: Uma2 family endonuclease [Deltaproteobacteria bacterium]|nr:Uma2 family endonuclease [Myxococcales bacterium]MDP3213022.1 Uma2 family endonuclease [Deltaproteobacteria bacterium]
MMGDASTNTEVTYDAYLALERSTNWKHEWIDGVAYAMAGGTPTHSRLSAQMIVELARLLGERPCAIHTSDLKVRPEGLRFATYPDVAVVCGEAQTHADDPNAVTNPVVLVEVLSDSTERWDRTGKFRRYRKIASLRDYVLVSQSERCIEVYSRGPDDTWTLREAGEGESVPLSALEASLDIDRVFRGVTLTPEVPRERAIG